MPNYAILRTKKLKSVRDLTVSSMHNGRQLNPPNADDERADLNFHSHHQSAPIIERWNERAKVVERKIRPDAVRGIEVVLAYSPEAKIGAAKWKRTTRNWLNHTFGEDNILQFDYHADETTPHVQAIVIPVTEDGRLSAKDWLGGREKLSKMQDSFAAICSPLGLVRGKENSKRKHTPIAEYHNALAAEIERGGEAPEVPEPPRLTGRAEYQAKLQKIVTQMHEANAVAVAREKQTRRQLSDERALRATSKSNNLELVSQIEANKAEIAKMKATISPHQLLEWHGYYPDRKEGKETLYETEAGYISVNENGLWATNWSEGGKSIIDLEIALGGGDFKEAVGRLKSVFGDEIANSTVAKVMTDKAAKIPKAKNVEVYRAKYKQDPSKWKQARDYLLSRLIPSPLVDRMHEAGAVWANAWGSVCFGAFDLSGNLSAVHVRGTRSGYKGQFGGKGDPFEVAAEGSDLEAPTALCESPIDCMSYHALTGHRAVTYGGVTLPRHAPAPELIAFDNDEAGNRAAAKIIKERGGRRVRPSGLCSDWAEMLEIDPNGQIDLDHGRSGPTMGL